MRAPDPDGRRVETVLIAKAAVAPADPDAVPPEAVAALAAIVRDNVGMVATEARWAARLDSRVPVEDRTQIGWLGLIDSVRRFDPDRGAAFATAAMVGIRGRLLTDATYAGWPVRVPRVVLSRRRRAASGRAADGYDAAAAERALGVADPVVAAQALDHVADHRPGPFDVAAARETTVRLRAALGRLRPRQAEFLARRYGLGGGQPVTAAAIAREWGVSQQRVSAFERRALADLRRMLGDRA